MSDIQVNHSIVSDLNTLCITCDDAASEAASIADLRDDAGVAVALERIHRNLIDALSIVGRLETGTAYTESHSHIGDTQ